MTRRTCQEGVALIKLSEGYEALPYFCAGAALTTGHGHVIRASELGLPARDEFWRVVADLKARIRAKELRPKEATEQLRAYIRRAGLISILTVTPEDAEVLLRADMAEAEAAVERLVKRPLTDRQFAALVSLVYNVGAGELAKSRLLEKLNRGDYRGAAEEFDWIRAGDEVQPGLVTRRAAERAMFLEAA